MALRPRSIFWIVSRHVLITGFVLPGAAHAAALAGIRALELQGAPAFLFFLAILALGFFAGLGCSLSYLRKNAITDRWTKCTAPAIVGFAAVAVLAYMADMFWLPQKSLGIWSGLAGFYAVVVTAFGRITRRAFEIFQRLPMRRRAES